MGNGLQQQQQRRYACSASLVTAFKRANIKRKGKKNNAYWQQ